MVRAPAGPPATPFFSEPSPCPRVRAADRLLLLGCAAIALAGPIMAVQEVAYWRELVGLAAVVGSAEGAPGAGFRELWHVVLLVLILVVGVLGTLQLARVARSPRVRPLSARLLALLLAGMVLLDVSFLLDRMALSANPLLRALTVVWLYPLAAVVVMLSAARLAELEEAFAAESAEGAAASARA